MGDAMTKKMTQQQILIAARALLAKRGGWGRHQLATNREGRGVPPGNQDAVTFCALGSLKHYGMAVIDADALLWQCVPGRWGSVAIYNDAPSTR